MDSVRRLAESPDRRCLDGYGPNAARDYRHPPDVGARSDRRGASAALRRWRTRDRFDWRLYDQSGNRKCSYARDCDPGRSVLCHQPAAVDPGRYQPQTDLRVAGRAKYAGSAGCTGSARKWWWRLAQSAARRHTAGRPGGPRALRAAGATVKMKSLVKGRELRPFTVMRSPVRTGIGMKIVAQAFGKSKIFRTTHRRRTALCFSGSSNRFVGAKG